MSKIEVTSKGKQASYSINLVWLSTDFFKSLLVSRIRTPLDQPGSFIVPDDIDEVSVVRSFGSDWAAG